jgi:hypothetical protein
MSYYDTSYPPSLWQQVNPATGADAGIPGDWTPSGSTPPSNPVDLAQGIPNDVIANPATAWTSGQFVQTGTAGPTGRATWTGTGWVGGAAPLVAEPEPEPVDQEYVAVPVESPPEDSA